MKKLMLALALTATVSQAHAWQAIAGTYISGSLGASTIGGMTTSGKECEIIVCKEAAQVLDDSQNYIQSGEMSAFLSGKIKNVQAIHTEMSDEEALDALIQDAELILK